MTVQTTSMSLPVPEHAPTTAATPVDTASVAVDAEARRLSEAISRGDDAAFRELYDRYHHRLFRLALVVGQSDEAMAHETVQAVFLTAASKLRRVESENHLWNWLARIARQQISKSWRQKRKDSALVPVAEMPEMAASLPPDSALEERLDAALLASDPSDRELIQWFYFESQSHKQIAERLGATPRAISSRLERARAKLRSLLGKKSNP